MQDTPTPLIRRFNCFEKDDRFHYDRIQVDIEWLDNPGETRPRQSVIREEDGHWCFRFVDPADRWLWPVTGKVQIPLN
jgi:hypothetical protein